MIDSSFRWAENADQEQILEIITAAFGMHPGTTKWDQASRLVRGECHRFRVMQENRCVVGVGYVCHLPIQIGCSSVELGYIGQVAVRPDVQKQGRGTLLINDLLRCMREQNYDIARLSGLVRFYQRFGWSVFPRRFVEFPLQDLRAGTARVPVTELLSTPRVHGVVREYNSASDKQRRQDLMQRFNRGRTGASARPVIGRSSPLHHVDPTRWRLVFERDGQLHGYVATHVFPHDVSDFESSVNLYDVAFDLDVPDAVTALLKHVLWTAHQRGARRVTARLPWDQRLMRILRGAGMLFEQIELTNAATGNMLRLMDLFPLLQKIEPELTRRWLASGCREAGLLRFDVGNHRAALRLSHLGVQAIEAPGHLCWSLTMDEHHFFRMLLGLNTPEHLFDTETTSGVVVDLLRILFPEQPTASTNWG